MPRPREPRARPARSHVLEGNTQVMPAKTCEACATALNDIDTDFHKSTEQFPNCCPAGQLAGLPTSTGPLWQIFVWFFRATFLRFSACLVVFKSVATAQLM